MADYRFRSALEAGIAAQLEANNVTFGYEEVRLDYKTRVPSGECDACLHRKVSQRRRYLADFTVARTILEVKGYFHARDRAKMLAVKQSNPEWDIRLVFGADNRIRKGSDERYSDWCAKHGFKYCVRIIPKTWLRDFARRSSAVPSGRP